MQEQGRIGFGFGLESGASFANQSHSIETQNQCKTRNCGFGQFAGFATLSLRGSNITKVPVGATS